MKTVNLDQLPWASVSHPPLRGSAAGPEAVIAKKVMLRSGEIPHLTHFSQAYLDPGQGAAVHAHADMAEVFFVSEGMGAIEVDGQVIVLRPGTCVLVEPGEEHEVQNTGSTRLVLTYFGLMV